MRTSIVSTLAAAALSALLGAATPAAAATVSGVYTGHITSVDPALAGAFAVNDPYLIAFSYDTSVADNYPADPKYGRYLGAVTDSFAVGSYFFSSAFPGYVGVSDNAGVPDEFAMQLGLPANPTPINGYTLWAADVVLDGPPTLFSSDALPQSFLPLSVFTSGTFGIGFQQGSQEADVFGVLDTPVATPAPAALPLFLTALAGLGCLGRRRRRFRA